jgi:hypothetical protein
MAIPSQQIGWSQRAKLLWNISKQLENLIKVAGNVQLPTTTTTSTTIAPTTTTTSTTETPTTTTTTTSAPVTVTAAISAAQVVVCSGIANTVTVTFSSSSICDSNTVTNTNGDFVGFTDIWLAVGGQSRLYVNVDNISAVSSTSCIACPTTTTTTTAGPTPVSLWNAYSSSMACAGMYSSSYGYWNGATFCDSTTITLTNMAWSDLPSVDPPGSTWWVSNINAGGNNVLQITLPAVGEYTATVVSSSCQAC